MEWRGKGHGAVNPQLDETQVLLRDTLRQFLERELSFDRVRECEREARSDDALWRTLVQQGWLATPFPANRDGGVDGGGGGMVAAGILVEEFSRRAALVPIAEVLSAALTLQRCGAQCGDLLRRVLAGEAVVTPAILEAGDSFDHIAAEALPDESGEAAWLLRGEKCFVDYAQFASHHLVAAQCNGERGLYLVATSDPGVKCEPTPALGRIPQAQVRYDGARAVRAAGAEAVGELVRIGRALACAQLLACMEVSLEQTVAYTNLREQFGRALSTFQAVQHHAANMAMHCEASRFLTYELLDAMERNSANDQQVALAKASLSRAAPEVLMTGHQLHGGQGFIEENDLYFFTLRGKDRSVAWGSAEECLALAATGVEQKARWL